MRSNYQRYWEAPLNRPDYYPLAQQLDSNYYRPQSEWIGRLILPKVGERTNVLGAWFEIYHTPEAQKALVGAHVRLRWEDTPDLNARLWGVTRSVYFDEDSYKAAEDGMIIGERLDGLGNVNPLESLAGAHPYDDMIVRLDGTVRLDERPYDSGAPIINITRMPIEITGRFYALVTFLGPAGSNDNYRVRHFNRASHGFDGHEELVRLPEVMPDANGVRNSTASGIERSPLNVAGWYIFGAQDMHGQFVVRALAPRTLLRLPEAAAHGYAEGLEYLRPKHWKADAKKGAASVALLHPDHADTSLVQASWREGDQGLLIHLYGGIGGEQAEPAAKTPLYWGHFAFGVATVVREPLADELIFDIVYHQVYAHNPDGTTAGALHYSRYAGDRQYGWAGVRPIQDIIIKYPSITAPFTIQGEQLSALDMIVRQLEVMTARYRIADGRGGTKVGASNNCAQDSAQALYTAIRSIGRPLAARPDLRAEIAKTPEDAKRLDDLTEVGAELKDVLLPWGSAREDWEYGMAVLGSSQTDGMFSSLTKAVASWRTMFPPVAARALTEVLLKHGASAWVLRSYQIGGDDATIEPYVPNV